MNEERPPRPFAAIQAALMTQHDISHMIQDTDSTVRMDPGRGRRTGIPEVVYAAHKTHDQIISALDRLVTANGRAMASRCPADWLDRIANDLRPRFIVESDVLAHVVVVARPGVDRPVTGGRVGVITAGSSDAPVAREAIVMATEMGCAVTEIYDVGVAGLHRLVVPLETMIEDGVDSLIVVAGMDGALPSVIAGLVDVPVIGLPTSVGYGWGGEGHGALAAMLQSCAPGLAVVNIDNGIGAGSMAALIANRAAAARRTVNPPMAGASS